jgi:hypothetical protein
MGIPIHPETLSSLVPFANLEVQIVVNTPSLFVTLHEFPMMVYSRAVPSMTHTTRSAASNPCILVDFRKELVSTDGKTQTRALTIILCSCSDVATSLPAACGDMAVCAHTGPL